MTSCRHRSARLPLYSRRILLNLSYGECQRTIYRDNLGDIVYEGDEYRSITTTTRTECVDLNPLDLECPYCINSLESKLAQEEASISLSSIMELGNKFNRAYLRPLMYTMHKDGRMERLESDKLVTIEHVMERSSNKFYDQGRGTDAVAWAAALSSELASFFGRFDKVELLVDGDGQVNDEECSICLRGRGDGRSHVRLPCQHVFHGHCVATWLKKKRSCPMCRLNLVELNNQD